MEKTQAHASGEPHAPVSDPDGGSDEEDRAEDAGRPGACGIHPRFQRAWSLGCVTATRAF